MEQKSDVIKHSAAVHIENKVSLLQRRAWNILLANAYDELPRQEVHDIKVPELVERLGYDSKDERHLKEALRALATCAVEWDTLDKDGSPDWGITTLLAQARIRNGVCTYAYSPELRERLHNPKVYARISLSMQNEFTSKHALALYELFVDYLDESRNYGETPYIPLGQYRKLMGIPEAAYAEFKKLNTRVIKEPIEEINKRTDLNVAAEYQRKNRKVVAIKFRIRRELQEFVERVAQAKLFPDLEDMPAMVQELRAAGLSVQDAWDVWQQGFEYVDAADRPKDMEYETYIREKIDLLKRRQATGKVENITGFLLTAIKKNYVNGKFAEEEKRNQKEMHAKKVAQKTQYEEELRRQFDIYREERFWEKFRSQSQVWREAKTQEFLDKIQGKVEYKFVWESYQRSQRLQAPMIAIHFMQELEHELLTEPAEMSFEVFREGNNNRAH